MFSEKIGNVQGAVHHDELLYLLRVPVMTPPFKVTDPENTIINQLTGWWTNFAQTGLVNLIHKPQIKISYSLFQWIAAIQMKVNSFHHSYGGQQHLKHQNIWKSMISQRWERFHFQIDMIYGRVYSLLTINVWIDKNRSGKTAWGNVVQINLYYEIQRKQSLFYRRFSERKVCN